MLVWMGRGWQGVVGGGVVGRMAELGGGGGRMEVSLSLLPLDDSPTHTHTTHRDESSSSYLRHIYLSFLP